MMITLTKMQMNILLLSRDAIRLSMFVPSISVSEMSSCNKLLHEDLRTLLTHFVFTQTRGLSLLGQTPKSIAFRISKILFTQTISYYFRKQPRYRTWQREVRRNYTAVYPYLTYAWEYQSSESIMGIIWPSIASVRCEKSQMVLRKIHLRASFGGFHEFDMNPTSI